MSRWFYPFRAMDPANTSKTWEVGVSERLFRTLQRHGHEPKLARLSLVEEVFNDLTALIEGWCRPEKEDECYVYVGKPEVDRRSLTVEAPPPKNSLFLVFVTSGGEIDDWNWRPSADDNPELPSGLENGRILWPKPLKT